MAQFAGEHDYCTQHAKKESDFGKDTSGQQYWCEIKTPSKAKPTQLERKLHRQLAEALGLDSEWVDEHTFSETVEIAHKDFKAIEEVNRTINRWV